jgi:virulence factor Mce family protein
MKRIGILAALVAGSLTLGGCGFTGLYGVSLPGGADLGNHPYDVTAYFSDVLDLVPQSAVKVNDVPVGKVTHISLADCPVAGSTTRKQWCAKVTLAVNGSVDLPSNSHAEVKQTSLLGEKYVALEAPAPGTDASTRLHNGSQIPFDLTTSAPEVEQVLGALSLLLNDGGLTQIQNIAKELNDALDSPQRVNALRDLVSAGGPLQTFLGTLDNQKNEITTALDNINTLAATLNQQKKVITDALDTYPAALKILAQERGQLVTLLSSLANLGTVATRVIGATQQDLVASLKSLDPVVTRLAAAGSNLPNALKIMLTFPFPLGTTRTLVKGDYANLDAVLNLSAPEQLCGLLPSKLGCAKTAGGASAQGKQVSGTAQGPSSLPPMLIGAGG